jgi:PadR family transcriptional regulator PadR
MECCRQRRCDSGCYVAKDFARAALIFLNCSGSEVSRAACSADASISLTMRSTYVDLYRMSQARKFSEQTLALLAVLIAHPRQWRHGYDLSRETGLKSGTLYPILMRLCDRGILQSKWEAATEPGRPPRHIYRLTAAGSALASKQLAAGSDPESLQDAVGSRA